MRSANFASGFDYNFGFSFYNTLKSVFKSGSSAASLNSLNTSDCAGASPGEEVVRYITNHDVNGSDGTPVSIYNGNGGAMAAFVIACCMKGVPMIYNGQEVGMTTAITFPFTGVNINWNLHHDVTAEYKTLMTAYNASAALRQGNLAVYTSANVSAFTKILNSDTLLVMVNVRNTDQLYTVPANFIYTDWINTLSGKSISLTTTFDLPPYDYFILKKE